MEYKIIEGKQLKTSNWSGGTTTELFISPSASKYEFRNFDFRISTATVEVEESIFTPLPKIKRTLMVLDGKMELIHSGHHSKILERFDSDYFGGGWETKSMGKCTDFNLMTQGETDGTVESLLVDKDYRFEFELSDNLKFLILYVYSGQLKLEEDLIDTGSLIVFKQPSGSVELIGQEKCDLIITKIFQ